MKPNITTPTGIVIGSRRQLAVLGLVTLVFATGAGASGGPDAWGMTWTSSDDPGGPVFSWVDISALGTEITGFYDDNSVGPIDLGMVFPYYWTDVDELVVGSNGWISFDPDAHLLPCFPTIPSPGAGADQLVAPFMSDLTFLGAGNPASVRIWHDSGGQRTVVSFLDVPFWSGGAPGWIGSNSFQLILSAADGSIVFQYLDVDQDAFIPNPSCSTNLEIGIENLTGNIGLAVGSEWIPPDGWAVRFDPPVSPFLSISDPGPRRVLSPGSRARFADFNSDVKVRVVIKNFGSAATVGDVTATARLFDENGTLLDEQQQSIALLDSLEESILDFGPWNGFTTGGYSVEIETTGGGDVNPGNNTQDAELRLIDRLEPIMTIGYASTPDTPEAFYGYDAAVRFAPFAGESRVVGVDLYPVATGPNPAGFDLSVHADDGPGGGPGTWLGGTTVSAGSIPLSTWSRVDISPGVVVPCGAFWLTFSHNGPDIAIGVDGEGLPSRQTMERATGGWRPYKDRETSDFMLRAVVETPGPWSSTVFCDGFEFGDDFVWSEAP